MSAYGSSFSRGSALYPPGWVAGETNPPARIQSGDDQHAGSLPLASITWIVSDGWHRSGEPSQPGSPELPRRHRMQLPNALCHLLIPPAHDRVGHACNTHHNRDVVHSDDINPVHDAHGDGGRGAFHSFLHRQAAQHAADRALP